MAPIKIIKKRKKTVPVDPKKKSILDELKAFLEKNGYLVRLEELKRGAGWKVISGSCRALDKKIILVDKRLNINDQIVFLQMKIKEIDKDDHGLESAL